MRLQKIQSGSCNSSIRASASEQLVRKLHRCVCVCMYIKNGIKFTWMLGRCYCCEIRFIRSHFAQTQRLLGWLNLKRVQKGKPLFYSFLLIHDSRFLVVVPCSCFSRCKQGKVRIQERRTSFKKAATSRILKHIWKCWTDTSCAVNSNGFVILFYVDDYYFSTVSIYCICI